MPKFDNVTALIMAAFVITVATFCGCHTKKTVDSDVQTTALNAHRHSTVTACDGVTIDTTYFLSVDDTTGLLTLKSATVTHRHTKYAATNSVTDTTSTMANTSLHSKTCKDRDVPAAVSPLVLQCIFLVVAVILVALVIRAARV